MGYILFPISSVFKVVNNEVAPIIGTKNCETLKGAAVVKGVDFLVSGTYSESDEPSS